VCASCYRSHPPGDCPTLGRFSRLAGEVCIPPPPLEHPFCAISDTNVETQTPAWQTPTDETLRMLERYDSVAPQQQQQVKQESQERHARPPLSAVSASQVQQQAQPPPPRLTPDLLLVAGSRQYRERMFAERSGQQPDWAPRSTRSMFDNVSKTPRLLEEEREIAKRTPPTFPKPSTAAPNHFPKPKPAAASESAQPAAQGAAPSSATLNPFANRRPKNQVSAPSTSSSNPFADPKTNDQAAGPKQTISEPATKPTPAPTQTTTTRGSLVAANPFPNLSVLRPKPGPAQTAKYIPLDNTPSIHGPQKDFKTWPFALSLPFHDNSAYYGQLYGSNLRPHMVPAIVGSNEDLTVDVHVYTTIPEFAAAGWPTQTFLSGRMQIPSQHAGQEGRAIKQAVESLCSGALSAVEAAPQVTKALPPNTFQNLDVREFFWRWPADGCWMPLARRITCREAMMRAVERRDMNFRLEVVTEVEARKVVSEVGLEETKEPAEVKVEKKTTTTTVPAPTSTESKVKEKKKKPPPPLNLSVEKTLTPTELKTEKPSTSPYVSFPKFVDGKAHEPPKVNDNMIPSGAEKKGAPATPRADSEPSTMNTLKNLFSGLSIARSNPSSIPESPSTKIADSTSASSASSSKSKTSSEALEVDCSKPEQVREWDKSVVTDKMLENREKFRKYQEKRDQAVREKQEAEKKEAERIESMRKAIESNKASASEVNQPTETESNSEEEGRTSNSSEDWEIIDVPENGDEELEVQEVEDEAEGGEFVQLVKPDQTSSNSPTRRGLFSKLLRR
jgi:hypothetical protein